MKKIFAFLLNFIFVGLLLITLESCKKDKETPAPINTGANEKLRFTLNGDGYSNQSVVLTAGSTSSVALGGYSTSEDKTGLSIVGTMGTGKSVVTTIVFNGKSTGTFPLGADDDSGEAYVLVQITENSSEKQYVTVANAGTLTVTKYDNVGGNIEGTFTGTLTRLDPNTKQPVSVSVSNCKFSATRIADGE
jgi:hypothetical protein